MATLGDFVPFAGLAVQWLRAQKSFPEWGAFLVQCGLGVLAHWLSNGHSIDTGVWKDIMLTIGSTQVASQLANSGVAVVPRTNSQP